MYLISKNKGAGFLPAADTKDYIDGMITQETYSDGTNSIVITIAEDGVTVDAKIRTKPPYTGGANADAARSYAAAHDLPFRP